MRKKLLPIFTMLFVLLGMALAGCSGDEKTTNEGQANNENGDGDQWSGKTLRVSAQSWIIDKWPLEEAAKQFMEDHPGSKVVVVPAVNKGTGDSYLLQWSRGNSDVDLALGGSPADIAIYVAKDLLVEFDDNFFEDYSRDKFVKPFLDLGLYNDKQFSIPLLGEVIALNVRKDLMKEAGLTDNEGNPIPPKSWDELYDYAKKLTKKESGSTTYGLSVDLATNFVHLNYYSGLQSKTGNFLDGDFIDFESQDANDLLNFWKKVSADGFAQPDTLQDQNAGRNAFLSGGVAMLWTAASRTQEFAETFGAENVATLPLPGSENNGSIAFTHGIFIPKAGAEPDMAKAFIKEQLLNEYGQQWSATKYGKLPTVSANYEGLPEGLSSLLQIVETSKGEPLYKEQAKLTDLVHKQISNMLVNNQSVEDTLKNIDNGMRELDLEMD
ncbi:ABC transporter substrate-binding protein [Bacillus timonensis]|uniref:ABC transporter substrate-binding protein n=1 Tax=Bacillus timonensis TaxID=1033734 RepID=UPI0002896C80|nr:extracellular solute-binding protein [Bacillus timonensis]